MADCGDAETRREFDAWLAQTPEHRGLRRREAEQRLARMKSRRSR
jgi:chorismate-pyruvate lyase